MADAVESSALADDMPGRCVRQRSAWRLLLGHVSPYRWTILCGGLLGFLGGLASLAQPMVAKLAVDTLGQHGSLAGPVALLAGVTIGGALLSMAGMDRVLLLVTAAVLGVNAVAVLVVVPRIRRATERSQAAVGRMGAVLERALGGFRTIKAHGAEEGEIAAVSAAARQAWRRGVEVTGWTALMEASAGLAVQVSFLAVLGIGGARVASGALPVSS